MSSDTDGPMVSTSTQPGLVSCQILGHPNNPKGAQFFFQVLFWAKVRTLNCPKERRVGGKIKKPSAIVPRFMYLVRIVILLFVFFAFHLWPLRIFRILHLPYRQLEPKHAGPLTLVMPSTCHRGKNIMDLSDVVSTCCTMNRKACERPTSWQSSSQF